MNEQESVLSLETVLKRDGELIRPVVGDSMMPLFDEHRDIVRLIPSSGILRKHEIPLYRRPDGQYVLHRILAVRKNYYLIRGDNRTSVEKVPFSWVIAVASSCCKDGVWHDLCEPEMRSYAGKVTRFWRIRSFAARVKNFRKRMKVPKKERKTLSREDRACILLFRSAVLQKKLSEPLPADTDWTRVFQKAKKQKIAALLYHAVSVNEVPVPETLEKQWRMEKERAFSKELRFAASFSDIQKAFDENGIDYLPLKGILMQPFWPIQGTREFSDHDILIRKEQTEKADCVMRRLGYKSDSVVHGAHISYEMQPIYYVEIHVTLFANLSFPYADYMNRIWERALPDGRGGNGYRMTNSDFYLFFLAHFSKHYFGSGSGLRSFADFFFLSRKMPIGETERNQIRELGLSVFSEEISAITETLFGDSSEPVPDETLLLILSGGAYGRFKNLVQNRVRQEGKLRYTLHRVFLPYSQLSVCYPKLKRYPVLLPYYWLRRVGSAVLSGEKRHRVTVEIQAVCSVRKVK